MRKKAGGGLVIQQPERVALADVHFAEYNPRHISKDEMKSLKASILKHGLVLNLVVQRKSDDGTPLVLIGGHQRVRAARELCEEKGWAMAEYAWATVLDIKDREAKMLNVALNQISGEFDPYKLGKLFEDIAVDMTADEILSVGFDQKELDKLVSLVHPPELEAEDNGELVAVFAKSVTLSVAFDTVERRDEVKTRLMNEADARGIKPGQVIDEALQLLAKETAGRSNKRTAR